MTIIKGLSTGIHSMKPNAIAKYLVTARNATMYGQVFRTFQSCHEPPSSDSEFVTTHVLVIDSGRPFTLYAIRFLVYVQNHHSSGRYITKQKQGEKDGNANARNFEIGIIGLGSCHAVCIIELIERVDRMLYEIRFSVSASTFKSG